MNRRQFASSMAGAALGVAALHSVPLGAHPLPSKGEAPGIPFKISVMLWTVFGNLPFEQRLEKVAQAGYHNVELVGEFEKWSDDDFKRVKQKKRELGISFDCTAGLKRGVGNPQVREELMGEIRGMLPIMERLECPVLIVMSGNVVPGLTRQQQHQSCVEGLKRAADAVNGKGVTLLLENIDPEENPKYYLQSVAEGFKILAEVGSPQVKFLYDFFHEQIAEGNLIEKLRKNIDKVGTVHIADVPGRHEPGTGEINFINIYRELVKLNFQGYLAMEFLPTREPVESLKAARNEVLRYAGKA